MYLIFNTLSLTPLYYNTTALQNRYITLYYFTKLQEIFLYLRCIIYQRMGKNITVGEGHTERVKTDHRNGKQTIVQDNVEVRPVMEGFHNETVRDKYYFGREFVTLFSEDLNDLLQSGDLKFDDWKVLLYLIANLQKNNIAITNLDRIANSVKIDRTRVSRSLTRLKTRNIVVEMKMSHSRGSGPVTSVFQISMVNPNLCFNGQTKNYKKEIIHYPKLTQQDGKTLLNAHAESQRQKLLREQQERESLFPEYFQDAVSPDPESFDPETGEVLSD